MEQCASSLQEEPQYPTDTMLLPLVQLHRLAETADDLYRMEDPDCHSEFGKIRLQTHVKKFNIQIKHWLASVPASLRSSCIFMSSLFVDRGEY